MATTEKSENTPAENPASSGNTVKATPSTDVQAAQRAGVSEGEVKALRDDAGLNNLPGAEANVLAWEKSEEGQKFLSDEKARVKEDEAAAKATHKSLDDDGLSEAEKKYREALSK